MRGRGQSLFLHLSSTRCASQPKGGKQATGAKWSSGREPSGVTSVACIPELPAGATLPGVQSTFGDSTAPCRQWLPGLGRRPQEGLCTKKTKKQNTKKLTGCPRAVTGWCGLQIALPDLVTEAGGRNIYVSYYVSSAGSVIFMQKISCFAK